MLSSCTVRRPILLFVLLVIVVHTSGAQPFESLASYTYHNHLPADYREPEAAGADKFTFSMHEVELLVPFRIKTGDRTSDLLIGTDLRLHDFRAVTDGNTISKTRFTRLNFRAGISFAWPNTKHKTLLLGLPTFSTNGPLFSSEAFQMGGLVIHSIKLKDNFTLKFGLYYNREFYGNFFMGLAGVDWRLPNNWYIFGVLPGAFNIYKQVSPWFAFSISERGPNGTLLAAESEGDYVRVGKGVYSLYMFNLHFTPFKFSFGTTPADITFTLTAGHTLDRKFQLYLFEKELIEAGPFYKSKDGFLIRLTASLRVWQE